MASTVTVHIRAATSGIAGSLRSLRSSIGGAVSKHGFFYGICLCQCW